MSQPAAFYVLAWSATLQDGEAFAHRCAPHATYLSADSDYRELQAAGCYDGAAILQDSLGGPVLRVGYGLGYATLCQLEDGTPIAIPAPDPLALAL